MTGGGERGSHANQLSGPLLVARGLRVFARSGERTLVSRVDLELGLGETIGIVGESGSGKSLTARSLAGLLPRGVLAQGEVLYKGRSLLTLDERALERLRGRQIGSVFQDPFTMLNPVRRVGIQITEVLPRGRKGLSKSQRKREAVRRLREVGIADPAVVDRYPFQLSGGMQQRVAIAAALAADPEILIADEPATALDVTTQRGILDLLASLRRSRGMSMIFITHDLRLAFSICDRVYVLYSGTVVEVATAADLDARPCHPYTLGLLLSEPPVDRRVASLPGIPGNVARPDEVRGRCVFSPRCAWAAQGCVTGQPPLVALSESRASACIRLPEIHSELHALRRTARTPVAEDSSASGTRSSGARDALLSVDRVTKTFVSRTLRGSREHRALDEVTLQIDHAECVGLVGESGSGKTTLGRCLVGLETPDDGVIVVSGLEISDFGRLPADSRRRARRLVQMVFQDPYSSLNPARTIGDALAEAVRLGVRGGEVARSIADLLELVGLPAVYADRKPKALSGGELQRVAIARALAVSPRLLVCDEAVSALDVSVQAQVLTLLAGLRKDLRLSMLFITHDLAVVRQIADRLYVLYRGRIVEHGRSDDVLDSPQHEYTRALIAAIPGHTTPDLPSSLVRA